MGESKAFQVCYEGDLTPDIALLLRRLHGEANFENSWQVTLPAERHSAVILRYLRRSLSPDGHLLVAQRQLTRARDFLLIRHSVTEGSDYEPLYRAIGRLGFVLDLPFRSTFVVDSRDRRDLRAIGEELGAACPDDALMVLGISHDFAVCNSGASRMFVPDVVSRSMFRAF